MFCQTMGVVYLTRTTSQTVSDELQKTGPTTWPSKLLLYNSIHYFTYKGYTEYTALKNIHIMHMHYETLFAVNIPPMLFTAYVSNC